MTPEQTALFQPALFSHQKSLTNRAWVYEPSDDRLSYAIAQRYNVPLLIGQILVRRGVSFEQVDTFLKPTLKQMMSDPFQLKDMEQGVNRLISALQRHEKIVIFADYDVDGAASSAILRRYLADCGKVSTLYVPDRIDEGYGPNVTAIKTLKASEHQLMIMLDCGTTAFEPLAVAKSIGLEVIVIDHHTSLPQLPEVTALINPNRVDESGNLTTLCTAGLAFLFVVALHKRLRQLDWFSSKYPEPDLRQYLDLAALGTVCDVMPLQGLNRALVSQGLKVMSMRGNIGLTALADISGMQEKPTAYHLGFALGPRVNAGGRIGRADLGGNLLATRDLTEAREIASKLHTYNTERQTIETEVFQAALAQIETLGSENDPIIIAYGEGWHPGVIGIVASRLKERFHRPACVIGLKNGIGKGSGRSITGIHLGQAMHQATHKGFLMQGGGHAMAAGFTVQQEQLAPFRDFLLETLGAAIQTSPHSLTLEGILAPSGCTLELIEHLQCLEPFGNGNPNPRFAVNYLRCRFAESFGNDHIRTSFVGEDGTELRGVAFRSAKTPLGQLLLSRPQHHMHIAGTLKLDQWKGRKTINFFIEDIMLD